MSKGIHAYLNSGANAFSKFKAFYAWADLGITEAEWDEMSEGERDAFAKELAFQRSEWGYYTEED